MGRNQWQSAASANELLEMGVSARPGRGWRIFAVLVAIGAVSFVGAYYVPLFRAHQRLSGEYEQLSQAATGDRQKLATTVKALENMATERDTLKSSQLEIDKDKAARGARLERFQRELEGKLRSASSKKQVRIERRDDSVEVTLLSGSLMAAGGDELSDAGKKLLCQIADAGKVFAPLRYELRGLAKSGADSWETAAGRAASAAGTLTGSCRVEARSVVALASGDDQTKAGQLLVKIDGKPAGAGATASVQ
jgi:chemotaxis protein MotB